MKHMAIMGLMLAFALPAAHAETETPLSIHDLAQKEIERIRKEAEARDAKRDAELGLAPGTTARERQERREREQQERQARKDAERERQERTDALPPKARLAAELCHEADAVMAMVVDVARYGMSRSERYAGWRNNQGPIIEGRRYLPAAASETILKLSRLARNLRKEAEIWGFPCD